MFEYEGIKIHWLGHDAFWIEAKGKNIYLDPFKIGKPVEGTEDVETYLPAADIIITSHEHFDHCNADSINLLSDENTFLVGPKITQDILNNNIDVKKTVKELNPGGNLEIEGIKITAIPAYNTHRFRDPETKTPFHPKESGHIGPILDIDGVTIYHAGDSDLIDEMIDLQPTIALIPISGTYVMDVPEAVEAAKLINAKITIPMHVGRGIGEITYLEDFKNNLSSLEIVLLDLEEI